MKKQPPGLIVACCSHQACSPHSEGSWPDSFPQWCLGKFPFLRKERDDTRFFPLLAVTAVNADILRRVLNYLLKLYMASLIWQRCQSGICLPREPKEHSELVQGGKSAYSTFNVKSEAVRVLRVAARWNNCWSVSRRFGCSSPGFTRTSSPGAAQGGAKSPKAFFHSPSLSPPTAQNSWGSEGISPDLPVLPPPATLRSREILLKISNTYQYPTTTFSPQFSQAWSRLQRGFQ